MAARADKIPHVDYFKFNNSVLYPNPKIRGYDNVAHIAPFIWEECMNNFEGLLQKLEIIEAQSLLLTKEVVRERQHLELLLENIQRNIKILLCKGEELDTENRLFVDHLEKIENKRKVIYVGKNLVSIIKPTTYSTTNCSQCKVTCHERCRMGLDSMKFFCTVMKGFTKCRLCPGKCSWKKHANEGFVYDAELRDAEIDVADIRIRYKKEAGRKLTPEEITKQLEDEINEIEDETKKMIQQATSCIRRLEAIALRPDLLTTSDYIDILIAGEKARPTNGWKKRVEYLLKLKGQAEFMKEISSTETLIKGTEGLRILNQRVKDILLACSNHLVRLYENPSATIQPDVPGTSSA